MGSKGSRSLLQLGAEALQTTSPVSRTQRRAFAQSSRRWRHGPVLKFTNASNPELSAVLDTLREKVIMPTHLTAVQRELIYKKKNWKDLLIDPVVVNLDGEEFTLRPIDRSKDIPGQRDGLWKAIKLMQTKEDFDNIPRLLKGLNQTGLNLKPALISRILGALVAAGRQDVALECARRGKDIGFDLSEHEIVSQILWMFHVKAAKADFEVEETKKALAWAEQLFELVELPQHCGKGVEKGKVDPRAQPQNVGVLLELAAVRAEKHLGGKDVDGKVEAYARRLLATGLKVGSPATSPEIAFWLRGLTPVIHGIQSALKVLDPKSSTAVKLQEELARLKGDGLKYRSEYVIPETGPSLSVTTYDKLV